jgi:hypothetical protein
MTNAKTYGLRTVSGLAAAATLLLPPLTTLAQGVLDNLVQNGSFEASPPGISPWVWVRNLTFDVGSRQAADGTNFLMVSGAVYQDIPTTMGREYLLRFAFGGDDAVQVNGGPMSVLWGNQTVATVPVDLASINAPRWRYLEYPVEAAGSTTRLEFSTLAAQAFPFLDDVSVVEVPEPGILRLLTLILASHCGIRLLRRFSCI